MKSKQMEKLNKSQQYPILNRIYIDNETDNLIEVLHLSKDYFGSGEEIVVCKLYRHGTYCFIPLRKWNDKTKHRIDLDIKTTSTNNKTSDFILNLDKNRFELYNG